MKISSGLPRRSFLKRGLFGGALLVLGSAGGLAARRGTVLPKPPEGLLILTGREHSVLEALGRLMIPDRTGEQPPDAIRVGFNADRILAKADPTTAKEVKQLLGLFENALPVFLFSGKTQPFSQLAVEAQQRVLKGWRDSRLALRRTGYQALKALVMAAYYASPSAWQSVGYPGPPKLVRPLLIVPRKGGAR